jgi:hypothetical protein
MAGPFDRVYLIVSNMEMQIVGIFVNAAMPLVFFESESCGELHLYLPENLWRQEGLIFGPERYNQMVGLFLGGPGVQGLGVFDLFDCQLILVITGVQVVWAVSR